MTTIRTLAYTTLFTAAFAASAFAQTGDTRARVDISKSHTVVYPTGFESSNEQGAVTLSVGVDAQGQATHLKVAQSSGYKDLDNAAVESAMNWRYLPAMHDGDAHPDDIMLKVVYDRPAASAH